MSEASRTSPSWADASVARDTWFPLSMWRTARSRGAASAAFTAESERHAWSSASAAPSGSASSPASSYAAATAAALRASASFFEASRSALVVANFALARTSAATSTGAAEVSHTLAAATSASMPAMAAAVPSLSASMSAFSRVWHANHSLSSARRRAASYGPHEDADAIGGLDASSPPSISSPPSAPSPPGSLAKSVRIRCHVCACAFHSSERSCITSWRGPPAPVHTSLSRSTAASYSSQSWLRPAAGGHCFQRGPVWVPLDASPSASSIEQFSHATFSSSS
mmetsp:Transcript_12278/g.51688  ORF Transcript_12278/g.51688 Transcript_12278/m.51688 type:complete len:283 (+) Transcript_12278:3249-4097(+)